MKKVSIILSGLKKTLFATAIFSFLLGVTSCQDWLDMPSYTDPDSETVFQNEDMAELFILGCYRGLIHQEMYYHLGMGETVMHSSEDGSTNNSKYRICNYSYDPMVPATVTTIFKEGYRIIESTNLAISKLKKMSETTKRNALLGEALSIRAFCYLNLIRIYGDVPAVWTPMEELDPNDENTFYPKRSSRDEIYDQIISDLQQAKDWVPWFKESGYATAERLSKQGVYALLARTALYAGGYSLRWNLQTNDPASLKLARRDDEARVRELYQIANDACKAIIDKNENSLIQAQSGMSGFQYLWYNFCQRNFTATDAEMIWDLAQYGPNTNSNFGVLAQPGSRGGTYGSRKAMQFMLPTYYLSFDENDTRRDVTCTSYSIYFLNKGAADDTFVDVGTTYSCIMHGKFRIPWCVEPQEAAKRNLNIPVMRYADVLLMYAEAQNYLNNGPTQAAKDALKQVRDRAGVGALSMPSDQQAFEDALLQERKWEFAGEFMLRTDMIRMNRLSEQLEAAKKDMKELSKREGKYANMSVYRLYKFQVDGQRYGDKFLALDYIDLTDEAEVAVVKEIPTDQGKYNEYQAKLAEIVRAHGIAVEDGDKWYPTNMFEAYTSTFNGNARKAVGFTGGFNALQIGAIIYKNPTGYAENGDKFPNWIEASDGSDGLYYGFQKNCCELLPFAAKDPGHPMVDNPNLTQHPAYAK
ncbi:MULTISPECIES: RagB/SusD family nutrient uptake outer membrane protein [Bacteroides]|jgi:acyl-CoA-binding protein|uniref:RagB/SusD family nutrient uptake outer membrane protein n=1 Tax=Bacteroides TaxID=816 RepID=UPI001F465BEC|nr:MULTISPECIES: RagB/SusD family nutrient uptake outer membrane protein [Bacteroides]